MQKEDPNKPKINHMDFILKNCLPQQNLAYMRRKSQILSEQPNFSKKSYTEINHDSSNSDILVPERLQSNSPRIGCSRPRS